MGCSADGQPLLLPPGQAQELHSTATLNAVQRLFSHHLIQTFGCDYSTSLSLDTLQAKLRSFLELCTTEGPRHDTYILYYSGHTLPSGDWILAGKSWIAGAIGRAGIIKINWKLRLWIGGCIGVFFLLKHGWRPKLSLFPYIIYQLVVIYIIGP